MAICNLFFTIKLFVMTKILIILFTASITILYFMSFGHTDNAIIINLQTSKYEFRLYSVEIKILAIIWSAGYLYLLCQKFKDVQGTLWGFFLIIGALFSSGFLWYRIWEFIDSNLLLWTLTICFGASSFFVTWSIGTRRIYGC